MAFVEFISKVRQLDNIFARWMMRHFYFLFFQVILVGLFVLYFYEALRTLDQLSARGPVSREEILLGQLNLNILIITVLLFFNSFWMLFIFSGMERLRVLLKDINFSLMKRK